MEKERQPDADAIAALVARVEREGGTVEVDDSGTITITAPERQTLQHAADVFGFGAIAIDPGTGDVLGVADVELLECYDPPPPLTPPPPEWSFVPPEEPPPRSRDAAPAPPRGKPGGPTRRPGRQQIPRRGRL